jgi:hypothetical protein
MQKTGRLLVATALAATLAGFVPEVMAKPASPHIRPALFASGVLQGPMYPAQFRQQIAPPSWWQGRVYPHEFPEGPSIYEPPAQSRAALRAPAPRAIGID